MCINICSVGEGGKTAHKIGGGMKFKRELGEIGQGTYNLKPGSGGKDKFGEGSADRVYFGVTEEAIEICIGTKD